MTDQDPPRVLPEPLPAIHPVPEYAVTGKAAARYADMKAVLQVPWMGVVTMAFAHYPRFFDALWQGLRPVCASTAFVDACRELRAFTEMGVTALDPPRRTAWLADAGFGDREVDNICGTLEVFSHGNFPYLVIASYARLLLAGQEVGADAPAPPFEGRHAPEVDVPFVLMERHHADAPTQAVYDDVMATLGLPFVNTDYRAMARWPRYFAQAWTDLKPIVTTPQHAALAGAVYAGAVGSVRRLPNPAGLDVDSVQAAAAEDASIEEIEQVVQLFHSLLPGLVVNVAFFRAQLAGDVT